MTKQSSKVHPNVEAIFPLILYSDIHGSAPSEGQLRATLSRLPRNLFLGLLTAIASVASYGKNVSTLEGQRRLLGLIRGQGTDLGNRLDSSLEIGTRRIFISVAQLAALSACVCTFGNGELLKWPDNSEAQVLDCLLIVNEFVHDYGDSPTIDDLAISEVRALSENPEPPLNALWRYSLLVDWKSSDPRTPALPKSLSSDFEHLMGLNYLDYATASFSTVSWIAQVAQANEKHLQMLALDVDVWLRNVDTKSAIVKFIENNSITVASVRGMFSSTDSRDAIVHWRRAFVSKPLLQITDNQYLFPFPFGAASALGRGLLYRLLNGYNEIYGRQTGNLFLSYFGRFLETYVDEIFRRSLRGNGARVLRDVPYRNRRSTDNRFVDDIIIEGVNAAFVEVVAKRFRLTETIIDGDIMCLKEDLHDMIISKARQLVESITLFKDGRLGSVDRTKVKNIFPVIIVDEFPHFAAVLKLARAELVAQKLELPGLQIMEISELEMLEDVLFKGRAFTSILKSKTRRPHAADMSMTRFAAKFLLPGRLPNVVAEQNGWFSKVVARAREWGLT